MACKLGKITRGVRGIDSTCPGVIRRLGEKTRREHLYPNVEIEMGDDCRAERLAEFAKERFRHRGLLVILNSLGREVCREKIPAKNFFMARPV